MTGAVRLALGSALAVFGAHELTGILIKEAGERVLGGPPDEFTQVGFRRFLV